MPALNIPNFARSNSFNDGLSSAPLSGDIYTLTIKDVAGENLITGPDAGAMMVATWTFAVDLPLDVNVANSKRSTGRARFQEMEFTKAVDAATPTLYANCSAGTSLGEAKLQVGRISGGEYKEVMSITLTNPIISQISTGGYGEGKVPMDTFTINFTKCAMEYTAQDPENATGGKTAFGWDITTNTAA